MRHAASGRREAEDSPSGVASDRRCARDPENLTVVRYAKDCLRIPRRPFRPQDVAALVSLGTAVKIRNPHNWIAEGVVSRVADYDDAKPPTP